MKIIKSEFVRNITILMTGTVLAQVLSYAVSPIISRLYNEADMAELGLYMRIVSFISALATARFELALPLPKSDYHSFLIFRLSLKITKVVLLSSLVISLIYFSLLSFDLSFIWMTVISIVTSYFIVFINLGTNWSIRNKKYRDISFQKISNSISSNGFKLLFGFFYLGSVGLIVGTFLGYFLSSFKFIQEFIKNKGRADKKYSKVKTYLLAKEYKEFPLINSPHVFLDLGRDLLLAFFIMAYFGKEVFGSYVYSTMMLSLPFAVIGQSVSQVFFNKCSEMVNQGKSVVQLVYKSYVSLFLIGIIPFGILFFYGEPIFVFVFGSNWTDAGKFSEILSLWLLANFSISATMNLPIVLNRQRENFLLSFVGTSLSLISFGILPLFWGKSYDSFVEILWFVSLAQMISLVAIAVVFIYFAKKGKKQKRN